MGSVIGYLVGVQGVPGGWTWGGGGVLMVGLVLVVKGGEQGHEFEWIERVKDAETEELRVKGTAASGGIRNEDDTIL